MVWLVWLVRLHFSAVVSSNPRIYYNWFFKKWYCFAPVSLLLFRFTVVFLLYFFCAPRFCFSFFFYYLVCVCVCVCLSMFPFCPDYCVVVAAVVVVAISVFILNKSTLYFSSWRNKYWFGHENIRFNRWSCLCACLCRCQCLSVYGVCCCRIYYRKRKDTKLCTFICTWR